MNVKTKLKQYCEMIIKDGDFHDGLAPAIMGLADMLYKIAHVDAQSDLERRHIDTENGSAIGVFWAAQCIKEISRTQRFARALLEAVRSVQQQKVAQTVNVLYAGTGPFATLALPVMALLTPQEVQFTLLEINAKSYEMLQHVLKTLGLEAFVKHMEIADAATHKLADRNVDIVLSETMNRALIKEPQVSIMLNLANQVSEKTIFIPEEVKVSLWQQDTSDKTKIKLDELMVFNKDYMFKTLAKSKNGNWFFEEKMITADFLPSTILQFETEITVFQDNSLKGADCSLNFPEKLKTKGLAGRQRLKFQYSNIDVTGFKWQCV